PHPRVARTRPLGKPHLSLRVLGFFATILLSPLLVEPAAAQFHVSAPIQVSNTRFTEQEPVVAAYGNDMVACWLDDGLHVAYGYSLDKGRTWTMAGTPSVAIG